MLFFQLCKGFIEKSAFFSKKNWACHFFYYLCAQNYYPNNNYNYNNGAIILKDSQINPFVIGKYISNLASFVLFDVHILSVVSALSAVSARPKIYLSPPLSAIFPVFDKSKLSFFTL